jgi:hypothetical protein
MPKSKSRGKRYSPGRWLRRTVAAHEARIEAAPLTDDQQRDLGLAYWLSFQAMLNAPCEEVWHSVAASLNVAMILCERGFGEEYIDDIKAAQIALMRTYKRGNDGKSWALDADGIAAIRKALELHDAQVEIAERREIRLAINAIYERVNNGDVLEVVA